MPPSGCAGVSSTTNSRAGTPEAAALRNFNTWSQFPARNIRARAIINDGAFARVVVCAEVRHGLTDVWEEFSGEYGLSFVRGQWAVQDEPLFSTNRFLPVTTAATQQVFDRAETARLVRALSGRSAIQGSVGTIARRNDLKLGVYWSAILRLWSTDGQEHTVVFSPQFTATLRQCTPAAMEGA